jgi:hypothetical protein
MTQKEIDKDEEVKMVKRRHFFLEVGASLSSCTQKAYLISIGNRGGLSCLTRYPLVSYN